MARSFIYWRRFRFWYKSSVTQSVDTVRAENTFSLWDKEVFLSLLQSPRAGLEGKAWSFSFKAKIKFSTPVPSGANPTFQNAKKKSCIFCFKPISARSVFYRVIYLSLSSSICKMEPMILSFLLGLLWGWMGDQRTRVIHTVASTIPCWVSGGNQWV